MFGPTEYALAAGQTLSVDLTKSGLASPCEIELQNESALTLTVTIGGQQYALGAWKANKYPLGGQFTVRIDPSQLQSPAPANVPSSTLIVLAVDSSDPAIPGVFPYDLGRLTNVGSGSVNVLGNISGITGTVTIAGTINVGNTPAVTISGTPSVNIVSGTVAISGTPNINIQSQSVNLNTQQPQTSLGNFTVPNAGTNNATYNVPSGTHVIAVLVDTQNGGLASLSVQGVTSGVNYINLAAPAFVGSGGQLIGLFMSPVLSALDTQVKVTGTCSATGLPLGPTVVRTVAILDAQGVFIYNNTGEPAALYLTDQKGNILGSAQFSNGLLNTNNGPGGPIVVGLPVTVTAPNARLGIAVTAFSPANNTPTQIVAQNLARRHLTMYVTAIGGTGYFIYPNLTVTAGSSANNIVKVPDGGYWEVPRMPDIYSDKMTCQSTDLSSGGLSVAEWT